MYLIKKRKAQKPNGLDKYIPKKSVQRKRKLKERAYLDIIIIGKGLNYRIRQFIEVSKAKVLKVKGKEYKINQDAFFLASRNYISQKLHNLFRRKEVYTILFREGSPKPMLIEKPATGLTAGMLSTAEGADVTQKALAELFSQRLPGRKIIFLIAVIGVIALVYLVYSGQFSLGLG